MGQSGMDGMGGVEWMGWAEWNGWDGMGWDGMGSTWTEWDGMARGMGRAGWDGARGDVMRSERQSGTSCEVGRGGVDSGHCDAHGQLLLRAPGQSGLLPFTVAGRHGGHVLTLERSPSGHGHS